MIAPDNVFRALNGDSWSKHRSKQIQLRRAEPLARICRRADRTVVLNQQKTSLTFRSDLGHVAFFSPDLRQLLKFSFQRIPGSDALSVIRPLPRATRRQHALQTFVTKRILHRIDQRHTQFSISFGKQAIGFTRKTPELRRPADRHRSLFRCHQPFALQSVEMLTDRHRRQPEPFSKLRGVNRTFSFQEFCNGATGLPLARRLRFQRSCSIFLKTSLYKVNSSVLGFDLIKVYL